MAGRVADGGMAPPDGGAGQLFTNRQGQERVRMDGGGTRPVGGALATIAKPNDPWSRKAAREAGQARIAGAKAAAGTPGSARDARRAARNEKIIAAALAGQPGAAGAARRNLLMGDVKLRRGAANRRAAGQQPAGTTPILL